MKKIPFALILVVLVAGATGLSMPMVHAADDARNPFVGNWTLVSFHTYPADGEPVDRKMTGRIMYDAAGNMAAQLMPQAKTEERVTPGYVAYFGTYAVDTEAGTVTHSAAGSNFSRWVGTDLVRHFEFADDQLTLSLKEGDRITGSLVWARAE